MKAIEDLSASFAGADCYFTVGRDVGAKIKELAASSTIPFSKLIKEDSDGTIAVHAKSLAALLKAPKQSPASVPAVATQTDLTVDPTATPPVVPPTEQPVDAPVVPPVAPPVAKSAKK